MTGWVDSLSKDHTSNWEICKREGLWGTPSNAGGAEPGDDLFLWKSTEGWLARCRLTTDARKVEPGEALPWPTTKKYRYLMGIDVISERPVTMTGTEGQHMAGLPSTASLGQFAEIKDVAAYERMVTILPVASPLEAALADLMRAVGIEVPPPVDARDYARRLVAVRRGQQGFRQELLRAFDGACCISGSTVEPALEAAHIRPYRGEGSHQPGNGLLLRTDVHTLFDLRLITVMPYGTVRIAPDLRGSEYDEFDERPIRWPADETHRPNSGALTEHNAACAWLATV